MGFKMFSKNLAEIVGELNAVHPFLDGNGRAIRVYAQKLSKTVGYELNVSDLRGDAWNEASEKFFFGDNQLLYQILQEHLSQI